MLAGIHSVTGTSINMDQFFSSTPVTLDSEIGWIIVVSTLLNSLFGLVVLLKF